MSDDRPIQVEVAFASKDRQRVIALDVPANTTADAAIRLSGIERDFPQFDLSQAPVGVFGKIVPRDHLISDGDRVEIYRELEQTPAAARRLRANRAAKK